MATEQPTLDVSTLYWTLLQGFTDSGQSCNFLEVSFVSQFLKRDLVRNKTTPYIEVSWASLGAML